MNIPLPRFRGRAIKCKRGWSFEFDVSMLGDSDKCLVFGNFAAYKTREEAVEALKIEIQNAIKTLAEEMPEIKTDTYVDMKTNMTRRWDRKDEQ